MKAFGADNCLTFNEQSILMLLEQACKEEKKSSPSSFYAACKMLGPWGEVFSKTCMQNTNPQKPPKNPPTLYMRGDWEASLLLLVSDGKEISTEKLNSRHEHHTNLYFEILVSVEWWNPQNKKLTKFDFWSPSRNFFKTEF